MYQCMIKRIKVQLQKELNGNFVCKDQFKKWSKLSMKSTNVKSRGSIIFQNPISKCHFLSHQLFKKELFYYSLALPLYKRRYIQMIFEIKQNDYYFVLLN